MSYKNYEEAFKLSAASPQNFSGFSIEKGFSGNTEGKFSFTLLTAGEITPASQKESGKIKNTKSERTFAIITFF